MVRASRSKRSENSVFKTFIATSRSSRVSRAFHTSPMPPSPIAEAISYGPSFEPGLSSIGCRAASIYYTEIRRVHPRCPLSRHDADTNLAVDLVLPQIFLPTFGNHNLPGRVQVEGVQA